MLLLKSSGGRLFSCKSSIHAYNYVVDDYDDKSLRHLTKPYVFVGPCSALDLHICRSCLSKIYGIISSCWHMLIMPPLLIFPSLYLKSQMHNNWKILEENNTSSIKEALEVARVIFVGPHSTLPYLYCKATNN